MGSTSRTRRKSISSECCQLLLVLIRLRCLIECSVETVHRLEALREISSAIMDLRGQVTLFNKLGSFLRARKTTATNARGVNRQFMVRARLFRIEPTLVALFVSEALKAIETLLKQKQHAIEARIG